MSDKASQNQVRAIIAVCAIGLATLLFAAWLANRASPNVGAGPTSPQDPIMARIAGTPVYKSDVVWAVLSQNEDVKAEMLEADSEIFQEALDRIVDQRVLALAAQKQGLEDTADVKRRVAYVRERILSDVLIETHINKTVTETAIRDVFEAQSKLRTPGVQREVRQIVLPDFAAAQEILKRLDNGENFGSLATRYSVERVSRENKGYLGFVSYDALGSKLSKQIFNTPIGKRAPVFETDQGWHIIEVLRGRPVPQPDYDDVKDDIEALLVADEVQKLLASLKEKANITYPNQDK